MQIENPKQGYKFVKTAFGKHDQIPENWSYLQLIDCVSSESGDWGMDDNPQIPENYARVKVLRNTDFKNWDNKKDFDAVYRLIKKTNLEKKKLIDGDILLETSGGGPEQPLGRTILVNEDVISKSNEPVVFSNFVKRIRTKSNINSEFLNYFLINLYNNDGTTRFETQTTNLRNFDFNWFLLKTSIPKPPMDEQLKIVSIIRNVGLLIHKIQQITEHNQRLKKGLIQRLFTKGAEHANFKNETFGGQIDIQIPLGWQKKSLLTLSKDGTQNGYAISITDYGKGTPIVGMTDLFANDILEYSNLKEVIVPEKIIENFSLKSNDLIFARRSLNVEGAGKCVLVPKLNHPIIFESSVIRMSMDDQKVIPKFVYYFLNSHFGKRIMRRIVQVVAVSGITSSDLKKLEIPIPAKLEEQYKIVEILTSIDSKVQQQQNFKSKLETLKKGLMQKLLTGQIRVKV